MSKEVFPKWKVPQDLYNKCLKAAIDQIKYARSRKQANEIYTLWKPFFWDIQEFKDTIENKKKAFKC